MGLFKRSDKGELDIEIIEPVSEPVSSAGEHKHPAVIIDNSVPEEDVPEERVISGSQWRKRVVVITGASKGIGLAAAQHFNLYADVVYNLSRTRQEDDSFNFIKTDITKPEQVKAAFAQIFENEGQIDVLINNAGMGISGSAEGTSVEDIKKIFDVNFIGLSNCCAEVLPYMRARKSGRIINISSIGGMFPMHFQSFYSATKAAVTIFSCALRTEVKPFKIKVSAVMLGDVKTNFTESRKKNENDDKAYRYRLMKAIGKYEYDEQQKGIAPEVVAKKLYTFSNKRFPKPVVTFGFGNKLMVFAARFLPTKWVLGIVARKF